MFVELRYWSYSGDRIATEIAVGIATSYRMEGPGIESRWGARFSAPVQSGSEAHPASYTGLSRGVKRPGSDDDHPPPSSTEVKERVEQYNPVEMWWHTVTHGKGSELERGEWSG